MSRDDWPSEDIPIPDILLPPKAGARKPSVRARNTNWKGVVGILIAVVVAPNLLLVTSSVSNGTLFAAALAVVVALPLVAVLAGVLMARDIREGASSSRGLAVAAIVVGLGVSTLMIIALALISVYGADILGA